MNSRQNMQIKNLRSLLPILSWRYWVHNGLGVGNNTERQEYATHKLDSSIKLLYFLSTQL